MTDCSCSAGVLTKSAATALAKRVASGSDAPSTRRAANAPMKASPESVDGNVRVHTGERYWKNE